MRPPSTARPSRVLLWILLLVGLPLLAVPAPAQEKQPLTHAVYDLWKEVTEQAISDDGAWVLWSAAPEGEDAVLTVKRVADGTAYTVDRGTDAQFAAGTRFVVTRIAPPVDSVDAAKRNDVPEAERPKPALGIVSLADGAVTRIERVQSHQLPEDAGDWLAYHRVPTPDTSDAEDTGTGSGDESAPLVVRHLPTGQAHTVERATGYTMANDASRLLVTTAADSAAGVAAALHVLTLPADGSAPERTTLHEGADAYPQMAIADGEDQVGFLVPDTSAARGAHALHHWTPSQDAPQVAVAPGADALPSGWVVSEHGALSFSASGARLFFGTAPEPPKPAPDTLLDKEKINVDVWHWQDPYLQPMQKERAEETKTQTYVAMHEPADRRTLQIATEAVPAVTVGAEGDADWALGVTNRPYAKQLSWDWPPAVDAHRINLQTGERTQVLEDVQAAPQLSPEARYITWWDREAQAWIATPTEPDIDVRPDTRVEMRVSLSQGIPHPVHNQSHDVPYPAGPYGVAGWTAGDERVLIYDKHDVWAVDPSAPDNAVSVTDERGRAENRRLRHVNLSDDREPAAWGDWPNSVTPPTVVPSGPLLFSAFDDDTKASGFYRDAVGTGRAPQELVMMPKQFSTPTRADDADRLLFTRESYQDFPDLWVSDLLLGDMQQMSDVNPQQSDYRWGSVELIKWTSANGEPLEGLLYKPEGFDPSQEYPMMTYFYEQYSDRLHSHHAPAAGRSVINFTFYASRGYLVFVPDIHYEEGYPGESAMQSVMPGVTSLLARGFVDRDRIGVQGHSWGGYQIAHMVTKTDLFAAAEAGAPVSNMVSAYGGIRWGSGLSRMFQYEETQSRIGGSLWEMPLRYLDNSPIFQADRIETPLLIMHNDEDGAVPWEQGIELFVALRRLGKPAWLINYNGADHWPLTRARKRDWTRRLQQFFDHYLQDAPAPVWLEKGIPAVQKGRTLGLEPAVSGE